MLLFTLSQLGFEQALILVFQEFIETKLFCSNTITNQSKFLWKEINAKNKTNLF